MKLDLSQATNDTNSSEELGALPEGRYDFIIDNTRLFESSKKKTPMFEIRLSVTDGEYRNRKAWRRFPLTPKAFGFVNELLEAIDSDLAGSSEVDVQELVHAVKNKHVSAYLTIEEYNGKFSNGVEKFTKVTGGHTMPKNLASKKEEETDDIFA